MKTADDEQAISKGALTEPPSTSKGGLTSPDQVPISKGDSLTPTINAYQSSLNTHQH